MILEFFLAGSSFIGKIVCLVELCVCTKSAVNSELFSLFQRSESPCHLTSCVAHVMCLLKLS